MSHLPYCFLVFVFNSNYSITPDIYDDDMTALKSIILNLRHFKAILFSEMGGQHLVKVGLAVLSPAGNLESQISKIVLSSECVFQPSDMCGIQSS